MKFDLDDFNFKEQTELMNMLNGFQGKNEIPNNQCMGFNEDTLYNFIESNKNKE